MTLHRAENTDEEDRLELIVEAVNKYQKPVVCPLHPRTAKRMQEFQLQFESHVFTIDPVGYLGMIELLTNCDEVLTDSGGLQKEAYWLGKPCLTLRQETEWLETVEEGWNALWSPAETLEASFPEIPSGKGDCVTFGNGDTAKKILSAIVRMSE